MLSPLPNHHLHLALHVEPPKNAPQRPICDPHPPRRALGQEALRGGSEHVEIPAHKRPDRPVGEDPALGEPDILELHRAREEDEVREPEAVPAVGIVPARALLDDVEQLSQRVERGTTGGVFWGELESGEAAVAGADEARAVICELGREDGLEGFFDGSELEL